MKATWKPDNRPEVAVEIASHTNAVIRGMQQASDKGVINTLLRDWQSYARDRRVCQGIIDAVEDVAKASVQGGAA